MNSKHREESPGYRQRSGLERFWLMPLRLMAGKNGYVSSVLKPTCGPGGVAGGVSRTFLQACKASTRKPSFRRTKSGAQGLHPRVVVKKCGFVVKKKSSRSFVHK